MTLSALIRKRPRQALATATVATPATHKGAKAGTVANGASVAVAKAPAATPKPEAQSGSVANVASVAVITELERLQWLWLERVAHLLQSTPEHLLQSGLIDDVDLLEQWRTEPRHAAALIRSCWMPEQYQPQPINSAKGAK